MLVQRRSQPTGVPRRANYVTDYETTFDTEPGTWGTFTYDSMKLLFDAVERAGGGTPTR